MTLHRSLEVLCAYRFEAGKARATGEPLAQAAAAWVWSYPALGDLRSNLFLDKVADLAAVISTLLIPPTPAVGAWGMNVEGIPRGHSPLGFAAVVVVGLILVGGARWMLRRMGMLS